MFRIEFEGCSTISVGGEAGHGVTCYGDRRHMSCHCIKSAFPRLWTLPTPSHQVPTVNWPSVGTSDCPHESISCLPAASPSSALPSSSTHGLDARHSPRRPFFVPRHRPQPARLPLELSACVKHRSYRKSHSTPRDYPLSERVFRYTNQSFLARTTLRRPFSHSQPRGLCLLPRPCSAS